ncbi:MAG: hypothetical protein ACE5FT_07110, partial [Candidatus Nanoarchaeia archaeon]
PYAAKENFYGRCGLDGFNAFKVKKDADALIKSRDCLFERHRPGERWVNWKSSEKELADQYGKLQVEEALEAIENYFNGGTEISPLDLGLFTNFQLKKFRNQLLRDMITLTRVQQRFNDPALMAIVDYYVLEGVLRGLQSDYENLLKEKSELEEDQVEDLDARIGKTESEMRKIQAKLTRVYRDQPQLTFTEDDKMRQLVLGIDVKKPRIKGDLSLLDFHSYVTGIDRE